MPHIVIEVRAFWFRDGFDKLIREVMLAALEDFEVPCDAHLSITIPYERSDVLLAWWTEVQ